MIINKTQKLVLGFIRQKCISLTEPYQNLPPYYTALSLLILRVLNYVLLNDKYFMACYAQLKEHVFYLIDTKPKIVLKNLPTIIIIIIIIIIITYNSW